MSNSLSSSLAIDSIRNYLASAAEAARCLNMPASADLQSLLRLAASEAERVRKAVKKPAKKAAAAANGAKKPAQAKRVPKTQSKSPSVANGRRRAAMI
jgi:hypothetical protein